MSSSMALRPPQPMTLGAPSPAGSPAIPGPLPTPTAPIPDIAALNINVPPPPPAGNHGRDREAQLLRRIRELEDENRAIRVENEKQVSSTFYGLIHCCYSCYRCIFETVFLESDDRQVPRAVGEVERVG